MQYDKVLASRFLACYNGKCYCDTPCPVCPCMYKDNCTNNATGLKENIPACTHCGARTVTPVKVFNVQG